MAAIQLILRYLTIPFVLLSWQNNLTFFKATYAFGYSICLTMIVLGLVLPKARKDKKRVEQKPKSTSETAWAIQLSLTDFMHEEMEPEFSDENICADAGKKEDEKVQNIAEESKEDGDQAQKFITDSQGEVLLSAKKYD